MKRRLNVEPKKEPPAAVAVPAGLDSRRSEHRSTRERHAFGHLRRTDSGEHGC